MQLAFKNNNNNNNNRVLSVYFKTLFVNVIIIEHIIIQIIIKRLTNVVFDATVLPWGFMAECIRDSSVYFDF